MYCGGVLLLGWCFLILRNLVNDLLDETLVLLSRPIPSFRLIPPSGPGAAQEGRGIAVLLRPPMCPPLHPSDARPKRSEFRRSRRAEDDADGATDDVVERGVGGVVKASVERESDETAKPKKKTSVPVPVTRRSASLMEVAGVPLSHPQPLDGTSHTTPL